jgi:hypothetical protein
MPRAKTRMERAVMPIVASGHRLPRPTWHATTILCHVLPAQVPVCAHGEHAVFKAIRDEPPVHGVS